MSTENKMKRKGKGVIPSEKLDAPGRTLRETTEALARADLLRRVW